MTNGRGLIIDNLCRIGIAFDFQNQLIRLFSWRAPIQTISFMCVYSFVCLDPYLLVILPLASLLLFIMVPAFLTRHPPPPSTSTAGSTPFYSYQGPALAPAKTIKPASETSKDFFHNMRDLQNCMADISHIHDATISFISPPTNFSDEVLSSTLFLVLSVVTASLFLAAHLLPWRFIFLIGGNAAVISGHPTVQDLLQFFSQQALENGSQDPGKSATDPPPGTVKVLGLSLPSSPSAFLSLLEATADVSLDSYPEEREVEIYELQYRSLSPYSTSPEWETIVFSPTPYDPLSPSRIAGNRPRGCRFFEDVQSPSGWAWKGKKWQLDLDCREWVVERMITGVGFEVLGNSASEGEMSEVGGWVWDLPPTGPQTQNEDGELSLLAYGDFNDSRSAAKSEQRGNGKGKAKDSRGSFSQDWEFGSASVHGMGEWRRRRWVRIVQRVGIDKEKGNDTDQDI
jgi:hypothetical protein